jgi:hypothetical protein
MVNQEKIRVGAPQDVGEALKQVDRERGKQHHFERLAREHQVKADRWQAMVDRLEAGETVILEGRIRT